MRSKSKAGINFFFPHISPIFFTILWMKIRFILTMECSKHLILWVKYWTENFQAFCKTIPQHLNSWSDNWDGCWVTNRRTGDKAKIQWGWFTFESLIEMGGWEVRFRILRTACFWIFPFNILGAPMTTGSWTMGWLLHNRRQRGMHSEVLPKGETVRIQEWNAYSTMKENTCLCFIF